MRGIWTVIKTSVNDFIEDDAMTLAGALAFYTALSLAPLVVMILWLVSLLWGDANEKVMSQAQAAIGPQGAEMLRTASQQGSQSGSGLLAKVIGIVTLIFGATGVFGQLQYSLNQIWDVEAKPGAGLWNWVRKRFLSLGMVVAIAFILLVSLVVSAGLSAVFTHLGGDAAEKVLWRVLELAVSIVIYFLLFAVTFKVLPDVKIGWRDVLLGALFTAVLFAIGKYLIGLYIGRSGTESAYGAAGSLIVMLLWVYYSALIVFFGAELTQAYVRHRGRPIEPSEHAVPIEKKTEEKDEKHPRRR
jgi:membrane protein